MNAEKYDMSEDEVKKDGSSHQERYDMSEDEVKLDGIYHQERYGMPENETNTASEDEVKLDGISHHVTGQLDLLTQHIDRHIRLYRLLPYVAGVVGVAFFLRQSRIPLRRLRQASDIPQELIDVNMKLCGVVKVTNYKSIGVWHIPLWKWGLNSRGPRKEGASLPKELLAVKFSGIDTENSTATAWLKEHLVEKKVWFQLLHRSSPETIECLVYRRKQGLRGLFGWRKECVNNILLEGGLGSLEELRGIGNNDEHLRMMKSLMQSEKVAQRKGEGIWNGTEYITYWNRMKHYLRKKN